MARSLDAPDSYDGVAQTVEAISETVHGAAGQDPLVAPAFYGEVGAARGSTDNQAQIQIVVPPSRQLLITDLGLESEAMRSATFAILDFIGWPEKKKLVCVCHYCYDRLRFKSDLWTRLARKFIRCRFWNRKIIARRQLDHQKWEEEEARNGLCRRWIVLWLGTPFGVNRFGDDLWDYCDWCGWWGWLEGNGPVIEKHRLVQKESEHPPMFFPKVYCPRCASLDEPPWPRPRPRSRIDAA